MSELAPVVYKHPCQVADEILAATGYWPLLSDSRIDIGEYLDWDLDEGVDGLRDRLSAFPEDTPAGRVVCAAGLFSLLSNCPLEWFSPNTDELERLANLVPVDVLQDPRETRWELQLAAAAQDQSRALLLAGRLKDGKGTDGDVARAAQVCFLMLHPGTDKPIGPELSIPEIGPNTELLQEAADLVTRVRAISCKIGAPSEIGTGTPEWSVRAAFDILSLLRSVGLRKPLTPTQAAICCWCECAIGVGQNDLSRIREAGRGFFALPPLVAEASSDPDVTERISRRPESLRHEAATDCFRHAGAWSEMAAAARSWVDVDPAASAARKALAEGLH